MLAGGEGFCVLALELLVVLRERLRVLVDERVVQVVVRHQHLLVGVFRVAKMKLA